MNGVAKTLDWILKKARVMRFKKKEKLKQEELKEFEEKGFVPYKK